jgi:hypothetical protein
MLLAEGRLRLERIGFNLLATVNQSRFQFDRGAGFDLAVAVED